MNHKSPKPTNARRGVRLNAKTLQSGNVQSSPSGVSTLFWENGAYHIGFEMAAGGVMALDDVYGDVEGLVKCTVNVGADYDKAQSTYAKFVESYY